MSSKDEIIDNSDENNKDKNNEISNLDNKETVENSEKKEVKLQKIENKDEKKEEIKKETKEESKVESNQSIDEIESELKDKRNYNKKLWIFILILSISFIISLFSTIFALLNLGKNTIAKGVCIRGIDISNLTIEEATNKINEAINIELMLGMQLVYNDYKAEFDTSQIDYSYNVQKAIKNAYNIGKSENILVNNYDLIKSAFYGKEIEMESSYNKEALNDFIEDISSKIPGLVVQASYYIEDDKLIIEKGLSGINVKKEELKNEILDSIEKRNALEILNNHEEEMINIPVENAEPEPIDLNNIYNEIYKEPQDAYYIVEPFQIFKEQAGIDFAISMDEAKKIILDESKNEYVIPLKITPAQKTVDDIGTEAFPYLISSFSTKYDASNINRSGNLKIAAKKINGLVLMPQEEFSFNEVVGKRTIEEGYTNAKIYENGQVVDGLAGGICQISSTLYNAVLLGNLEVTTRRNHSFTSSYVPAGRDATVVYGVQDFKFKNTRNYPIKIEANVANGIASFKIHGIKEEVEYDIKIIPVTTQTIPYATEYIPDPTLAPGQQVVVQGGHSGYKVTTYIEKRLAGVVASKEVLSRDTYNAMKSIVHVGQ